MRLLLYVCFLLSGITGLVYEVVWGKYLTLFIGATSYAHTIVLGTFMGGLALGNMIFGRLCDRKVGKLKLYAFLELGIGLTCALFPVAFDLLSSAYLHLASSDPESVANVGLKFLFAAVAILVPTILMGGTLPVLSKYVIARLDEVGSKVGWLYFINSLGAVFGCALAGFHLIRTFGLQLTMVLGATANIVIGLVFLYLKRYEEIAEAEGPAMSDAPEAGTRQYTDAQVKWTMFFIFASGFLTMVYELAWIRLLSLVMGSSTYSFSIMLMTFIGGITIGGLLVSALMRKDRDALKWFAISELGVFVSLCLMLPLYERLPYFFHVLSTLLVRSPDTFSLYIGTKVLVCFLLMAVPTIFIGMTLPLASRICVRRIRVLGAGVGSVFSVNTAGNLLGAALSGLVIIPLLGIQWSMELGILASGLIGAGLLAVRPGTPVRRFVALPALAAAFVLFVLLVPQWNLVELNTGLYRYRDRVAPSYGDFKAAMDRSDVLYHKDGADMSVVVLRSKKDGKVRLKVNGKTDAGTGGDMSTQILLGQIPMLLHHNPKKALVIGLGSGITVGSVLTHPVEAVDVVEISPEVVEASRFFDHISGAPLDDPRTNLSVSDAKDFLHLQTDRTYDAIVSEPSNPWIAGIGNLFTVEFFAEAKQHLDAGGIMIQWIHAYEMNDETLEIIFNSFSHVFEHVTVWHPRNADIILAGSVTPLAVSFPELERRIETGAVHADLNRPGGTAAIRDATDFLSVQTMGPVAFKRAYPGKENLNSDLFPTLEYEAPKTFFLGEKAVDFYRRDERLRPRRYTGLLLNDYLGDRDPTDEEMERFIRFFSEGKSRTDDLHMKRLLYLLLVRSMQMGAPTPAHIDEYLARGNHALYGQLALWRTKIEAGEMTPAAWAAYRRFEAESLRSTVSVFASPDTTWYEEAWQQCMTLFPAEAKSLENEKHQLYRLIGLK